MGVTTLKESLKTQSKQKAFTLAALGIAAASLLLLVKHHKSATPNPARQKPEQIAEYIRSDEFRNLDPNDRRRYMREAMRQRMAQHVKGYFNLEPEERIAYLDKVIDTMQSRRREFGDRRREFGDRRRESESRGEQDQPRRDDRQRDDRRRGRRQRRPEDMRARRESITPETGEFGRALRQRMQQRGMNFRRGPRG